MNLSYIQAHFQLNVSYQNNNMILKLSPILPMLLMVSQSSILRGGYCDQWSPCGPGYLCHNSACVNLDCSPDYPCKEGLECIDTKCIPTVHDDDGAYCDQWTKCIDTNTQCVFNKCVTLNCSVWFDCSTGFSCRNGKCVSDKYTGNDGAYCDGWTSCNLSSTCVNKKCIPINCSYSADCANGYVCVNGKCNIHE